MTQNANMTPPIPQTPLIPMATKPAHRRWFARGIVILAVMAVGVWFDGYLRWPTGPASGEGCSGVLPPTAPRKTTFRIGTFNIHSGVGEDDVFNLQRTIDEVKDVDLCGLNEVRGWYFNPPHNQAEELATATGHAWLFAPTERRYWHDDFGNGILTRLAVHDWLRFPLPIEPKHSGRRNAILARVEMAGRLVPVIVAHIDRELDQANQLRFITRLFDSLQPPSLLVADLNAERKNPEVKVLLALPGIHDCIDESNADDHAPVRIDWILSRGFKVRRGGHLQNGASDHPMYWVDLELNP